ncbi:hypothetical protein C8R44DRAFT_607826, partial [Mycena epipterygia]
LKTGRECDADHGIVTTHVASAPDCSPAVHCVITALRTATSRHPFNSVNNKSYYKMEVEMLRPGTVIPSATTVSRDLKLLYLEQSHHVKSYFVVFFAHRLNVEAQLFCPCSY